MNVVGVIVYYNPVGDVYLRLSSILEQVDKLILFSNGTNTQLRLALNELDGGALRNKYIFHDVGGNDGISAGLNFARSYAIANKYSYLATFDQDSIIGPGFIENMCSLFEQDDNKDIAILSPVYKDINSGEESSFPVKNGQLISRKKLSTYQSLVDVFCTITSGSACRVSALDVSGPFRDDYFIDYVDNEYCLRLWRSGYRVCVVPWVCMQHALGERKKINKIITVTPTNYSPLRKYYMTRNRLNVYFKYVFTFPLFVAYDISALCVDFFRIMFYERNRKLKLKAFFAGIFDAITCRLGKTNRRF